MLHDVMKELFLVKRWEGHVAIIDIVDVIIKLRDEECDVLQCFCGITDYIVNMTTNKFNYLNKHY